MNGLYLHGLRTPEKKKGVTEAARRAVSHVVAGFIGGLIEGIGEGVGEDLITNIDRGNPVILANQSPRAVMNRTQVIAPKEGI